jgi:hypothetical protein
VPEAREEEGGVAAEAGGCAGDEDGECGHGRLLWNERSFLREGANSAADRFLPSNHFYTDASGTIVDVGTGFYGLVGVEAAVLFGDFTPPKARKK